MRTDSAKNVPIDPVFCLAFFEIAIEILTAGKKSQETLVRVTVYCNGVVYKKACFIISVLKSICGFNLFYLRV